MSKRHPVETTLALYATGDLSWWDRFKTRLHLRHCDGCRVRMGIFLLDRERHLDAADDLPPGVNWTRLSAEMTANVRVGLAAGECVSSPLDARKTKALWDSKPSRWYGFLNAGIWKPALAVACLALVFTAAWWLNLPTTDIAVLGKVWDRAVNREGALAAEPGSEYGPVVAASSQGIEFSENGSTMGVSTSAAPASVTVSFGGSASARFVDDDTGQVTIATVYVP